MEDPREEEVVECPQGFAHYLERTSELLAGSDASRHGDWDSGTIKAAALALYRSDEKTPDSDLMIAMLKNHYGSFSDESAMASGEDNTRRFMDRADEFKFTSGLLDRLNTELTWHSIAAYKERGWHVVELKRQMGFEVTAREEGFYIFTDGTI